jgi:hypothetical protein
LANVNISEVIEINVFFLFKQTSNASAMTFSVMTHVCDDTQHNDPQIYNTCHIAQGAKAKWYHA